MREILLETSRFRIVRGAETLPDGSTRVREYVEHPGAVAIIPMVDADHVCLIENRRLAAGRTLIELPAGTLDPGEHPQDTAARELAEETGYRAAKLSPLCRFYVSPGILNEVMHLFLATDLQRGEPDLQPGEQISTRVVSWSDAMTMATDGTIQDAKSLVGLLLYDRLRQN